MIGHRWTGSIKYMLGGQFSHVMLIDGNDARGIDVAIMTTKPIDIVSIHSNVDEPDPRAPGEHLFSRDCAEYSCRLPGGATIRILLNHFKSQSGGGGEKRARQAEGFRKIVDRLVATGEKNLIVMGDLNEGPEGQGNPAKHFAPLYGLGRRMPSYGSTTEGLIFQSGAERPWEVSKSDSMSTPDGSLKELGDRQRTLRKSASPKLAFPNRCESPIGRIPSMPVRHIRSALSYIT
jgi:hypothetical protein